MASTNTTRMRPMSVLRRQIQSAERAGDLPRMSELRDEIWFLLPYWATSARLRAIERLAVSLSNRSEAAELVIFALRLRVSDHGWNEFEPLARRATALARRLSAPLGPKLVGTVDVLRARWHLETNRRATGVRFARRLCAAEERWVRHAGYSAIGLWALRSNNLAGAEKCLMQSLCAPDTWDGHIHPWFGLFTALRRRLPSSASVLEYAAFLNRWHARHPFLPAVASLCERMPDFPWQRPLPEVGISGRPRVRQRRGDAHGA